MKTPLRRRLVRLQRALIGAVLLGATPSVACDLPAGETATVGAIEDGETLTLTDGRKVRLLGVKAPSAPLGWKGDDPWPFVAEAKAALSRLVSGAAVELRFDERRSDRHGHVLAQVTVARGQTLDLGARGARRKGPCPCVPFTRSLRLRGRAGWD